jgi:hypothetical protein
MQALKAMRHQPPPLTPNPPLNILPDFGVWVQLVALFLCENGLQLGASEAEVLRNEPCENVDLPVLLTLTVVELQEKAVVVHLLQITHYTITGNHQGHGHKHSRKTCAPQDNCKLEQPKKNREKLAETTVHCQRCGQYSKHVLFFSMAST